MSEYIVPAGFTIRGPWIKRSGRGCFMEVSRGGAGILGICMDPDKPGAMQATVDGSAAMLDRLETEETRGDE